MSIISAAVYEGKYKDETSGIPNIIMSTATRIASKFPEKSIPARYIYTGFFFVSTTEKIVINISGSAIPLVFQPFVLKIIAQSQPSVKRTVSPRRRLSAISFRLSDFLTSFETITLDTISSAVS